MFQASEFLICVYGRVIKPSPWQNTQDRQEQILGYFIRRQLKCKKKGYSLHMLNYLKLTVQIPILQTLTWYGKF